jgi:hypothetical protein
MEENGLEAVMAKKRDDDDEQAPGPTAAPRRPGTPGLPGAGPHNPRSILKAAAASVSAGKGFPTVPEGQKTMQRSSFNSGEDVVRRQTQLPGVWSGPAQEEAADDEAAPVFDGEAPAPEVTDSDPWKAVKARIESREGRRTGELYAQVLNQFAAGANPRYEPDSPDRPRAHIFVWDVSRAMGAEIPHMLGARELGLEQTADWLRYEASERGWVRIMTADRAAALAAEGRPVVVIPKDRRFKLQLLAMVRPEGLGPDGLPRVAGAGVQRGNDLSPRTVLGATAFEYFSHS